MNESCCMSYSSTFTKLALFVSTNVDSDEIVAKSQTWTDKIVKKYKRNAEPTVLWKYDNNIVESSHGVC